MAVQGKSPTPCTITLGRMICLAKRRKRRGSPAPAAFSGSLAAPHKDSRGRRRTAFAKLGARRREMLEIQSPEVRAAVVGGSSFLRPQWAMCAPMSPGEDGRKAAAVAGPGRRTPFSHWLQGRPGVKRACTRAPQFPSLPGDHCWLPGCILSCFPLPGAPWHLAESPGAGRGRPSTLEGGPGPELHVACQCPIWLCSALREVGQVTGIREMP